MTPRALRLFVPAALVAASALLPARAETTIDPADRGEIEAIVRDYLIANPEVLLEAMDALQTKQAEAQKAAQAAVLASSRDILNAAPEGTVIGNPEGDVTIVEFFDYNCGYCRAALEDMQALVEADPNVRFVLKEFPILGPGSLEAARVSMAVRALAPERYAEFHRTLLSRRAQADEAAAVTVATDLGLDAEAVAAKKADPTIMKELQDIQVVASQLQIGGTPSYVIGDEVLQARIGLAGLKDTVANMRDCGATSC